MQDPRGRGIRGGMMVREHTVLFVDDEVNILKALQRLLRSRDRIVEPPCGLQALAECQQARGARRVEGDRVLGIVYRRGRVAGL